MVARPNPLTRLSDRQRGALALVVGTLLVCSPLYVTALPGVSPAYTYRTAPATVENGSLSFDGADRIYTRIEGIGCTGAPVQETRACAMDRRILDTGPVEARQEYDAGERFVRIDGQFYRRVVRERNGTTLLALERVSAREALNRAAVPETVLTWPGRVLLLTGQVTTTYPLEHAGYVVETEDGFRLLYLASFEKGESGAEVLAAIGVVVGLWLLVRGYRRLPDESEAAEP